MVLYMIIKGLPPVSNVGNSSLCLIDHNRPFDCVAGSFHRSLFLPNVVSQQWKAFWKPFYSTLLRSLRSLVSYHWLLCMILKHNSPYYSLRRRMRWVFENSAIACEKDSLLSMEISILCRLGLNKFTISIHNSISVFVFCDQRIW